MPLQCGECSSRAGEGGGDHTSHGDPLSRCAQGLQGIGTNRPAPPESPSPGKVRVTGPHSPLFSGTLSAQRTALCCTLTMGAFGARHPTPCLGPDVTLCPNPPEPECGLQVPGPRTFWLGEEGLSQETLGWFLGSATFRRYQ